MECKPEVSPFLRGNFAPLRLEGAAEDLEVTGEIPRELNGTYYRDGPNPAYPPVGWYHWFDGDGMIHAVTLRDGCASYQNRWVRTRGLLEERKVGTALYHGLADISPGEVPFFKNTANTNIVFHGGRLLALMELARPTELRPGSLETIGEYDFDGELVGPMTAHPKIDPVTGEMLFFGYLPSQPRLIYHVASREGELLRSEPIDLAWPSLVHDFAITENHVIFILCPLVFSFEKVAEIGSAFSWEPERGMRIGVMPRGGGNADVRWFDAEPCYIFHSMNAYAEREDVVLDVIRLPWFFLMRPDLLRRALRGFKPNLSKLHRFRLDLQGGRVRSVPMDEWVSEFPSIDARRLGRPYRFGYAAAAGYEERPNIISIGESKYPFTAVNKYDLERGTSELRWFGAGNGVSEPVFVPRRPDAAEDDGYVLVLVYDHGRNASDFHILDARNITGEPVATLHLPNRVPYGFHGSWVPA